jgi:hypothetical protein
MGMLSRRHLSTTEKMAAIFGPASLLPRCNQFFLLCEDLHKAEHFWRTGAGQISSQDKLLLPHRRAKNALPYAQFPIMRSRLGLGRWMALPPCATSASRHTNFA